MRPDQAKFDEFVAPLMRFDDILEMHAKRSGFVLQKNLNRQPGRQLKRGSNPIWMIGLHLQSVWFEVAYDKDLPYSLVIGTLYENPADRRLWKFNRDLASNRSLAWMDDHLSALLEDAISSVEQYTADYIVQHGTEVPNLRRLFADFDQGG